MLDDEGNCVVGGCWSFAGVGLLAAIAPTLALTADDVPLSGLREGRGRGFGDEPRGRWMVLRDLLLGPGPGEAPVLNDLPLWELVEVLLERRIVEFGDNDDDHHRRGEALRASVVKVEEVVEAENAATAKNGQYIATWPNMDLCMDAEKRPGLRVGKWWWD